MAFDFNPITSNLDLVDSPAGYINGVVADSSLLPVTLGTPPLDAVYLAKAGSGVWLINRKPAGLYVRVANNGNAADWTYLGAFPEVNADGNWELYNTADPTKELKFDLSGITTGTTRTLTVPNKSGTIATTNAADLTSGTLADARLSVNVARRDAANTFSANQTLNGTNNVAPNQTAASGSSLMTRSLNLAHSILPIAISGAYTGRLYSPTMAPHGMGQGNIRGVHIPLPACTIDRVAMSVNIATANGLFRLGVYDTNSDFYPTSLIQDFGTVSTNTTGTKAITVNRTFSAGVYYFALFADTAASSLNYFGVPDGVFIPFIKSDSLDSGLFSGTTYLSGGNSSGSMPANYASGLSASGGAPYIVVRFT